MKKFIYVQDRNEAHEVYGSLFIIPPFKGCDVWSIGMVLRERKRSYRILGSYRDEIFALATFVRILDFRDSSEKNVFYMPLED